MFHFDKPLPAHYTLARAFLLCLCINRCTCYMFYISIARNNSMGHHPVDNNDQVTMFKHMLIWDGNAVASSTSQGSFWIWAQPMRDDVTMQCCPPLAAPIPGMIVTLNETKCNLHSIWLLQRLSQELIRSIRNILCFLSVSFSSEIQCT